MEIKLLSCPLCLKPHFDGVDTLRTTLISAATTQISCPVCNESLMGLDKLTIHLFSHITNPATNIKPAEVNTTNEQPIEAEIKRVTTEITPRPIRCDICSFTFSDENILDMHQKLLHQTLEDKNTGLYSYHCHLCSKKFKMRGSLMVHLRVAHYGFGHLNDTPLENGIITDAKGKILKLDEKSEDGKNLKQWSCDVCSKLFTTKYFLKKHKRLHTGEMPYFCAQCNKYFTFQQSYHKHMLYHSSEKPHVCSECGRAFKELSTLHNHERIHSGERPFACESCGKCFRQRVSYLVHRRIHTGVMPYKCTACEKTFRYKVSQRSHKCPANPPGSVVRTNGENSILSNLSNQHVLASQHEAKISKPSTMVSSSGNNAFVNPNLNTVIINAEGEIIGQNFSFDGKSIITYANIQSNDQQGLIQKQDEAINVEPSSYTNENGNPDFFTMVMSPLPDVESLCLTNSPQQHPKTDNQLLQTINEDSFKELIYGQSHSPG